MFKLENTDGFARAGKLKTEHGTIETPFFMPVATKGSVKHISFEELKQTGTQCIISNAFIFYLKPGLEIIEKAGGIHKFINWNQPMFTDSGGFQMLNPEFLIKIEEQGVHFRSPFDGIKHFMTPEKVMEIEETLGADIAMCLDDVPVHTSEPKRLKESVERTKSWAKRCKESHTEKKQLLFGIAQGGTIEKLRKQSVQDIVDLDFDGIALGGLCIGETRDKMNIAIQASMPLIPENKPRYLMGVGTPFDLVNTIGYGTDCFDSCFVTRSARHGLVFTQKGNLNILHSQYKNDLKPLDPECECFVCQNYSRAYIRHLKVLGEENGLKYLSYHDLFFVQKLMKETRISIQENRFEKFKTEFLKIYKKIEK
ncbi:MAG: tRNA guanosine(34) transglycosylase Tgt [Candidatus Diapherotrites archaeon]|nr:tRNA guanosine(34) transglycosylase Tgt [Candidatus Diapherotrites archaeon]